MMDKIHNISSQRVVIVLVRSFFDAFSEGVIESCKLEISSEKYSPHDIKAMMLDHYGSINSYFFDVMFYIISRISHDSMDGIRHRLDAVFANEQPTVPELMRVACGTEELYLTMVNEYKYCFSLLLAGERSSLSEHLVSVHDDNNISTSESLAIQLIVRTVVKAYLSGLSVSKCGKTGFRHATVFRILACNINCLVNEKSHYMTCDTLEEMLRMACGSDANMTVAVNELNSMYTDIVDEC